jgi:hypothetical protein
VSIFLPPRLADDAQDSWLCRQLLDPPYWPFLVDRPVMSSWYTFPLARRSPPPRQPRRPLILRLHSDCPSFWLTTTSFQHSPVRRAVPISSRLLNVAPCFVYGILRVGG